MYVQYLEENKFANIRARDSIDHFVPLNLNILLLI